MRIGYASQHAAELGGDGTAVEALARASGLPRPRAQALLARFGFSGAEQDKPLAGLSGGERQRLSLAILVSSGANLLVLDEPTNHLDTEGREALEAALLGFGGTVLVVTHDRALLDAVATRLVAIEDQRLRSHLGGWADYLAIRREPEQRPVPGVRRGRRRPRAAKAPAPAETVAGLERRIERQEQELAALEDELSDPDVWRDPARSAAGATRHAELKQGLAELYADWERRA